MPKLALVGEVPITWDRVEGRYISKCESALAAIFNRMRPVPDPIIVTTGPNAKPGGNQPWEGNDPHTGRRYVARPSQQTNAILLQEVID